jgi:hypothetical protein
MMVSHQESQGDLAMPHDLSEADAQLALRTIDLRAHQVIDEVDQPRWYWAGLAIGWIVLGLIIDTTSPWVGAVATCAFGAMNASVASHVNTGRHRSSNLSVRADRVDHRTPLLVAGFLVVLGACTVGLALLARADGARHPVTAAAVVMAVTVYFGGQHLMSVVRSRLHRRIDA